MEIHQAVSGVPDHQFNLTLNTLIGKYLLESIDSRIYLTPAGHEWLAENILADED